MQLFPWIFIPGIKRNFVLYPHAWQLLICALGLAVIFIRWKPTNFRIFSIWVFSTIIWSQILIFLLIFGKNHDDLTILFWIFTSIIIVSWGYGNGIYIGIIVGMIIVSLERKGYIKRKKISKGKKKKRKERK
jgi:hypothetical protein